MNTHTSDDMEVVAMQFHALDIGKQFLWLGDRFVKIQEHWRPRYGKVNCILMEKRYYDGDSGHRTMQPDTLVQLVNPIPAQPETDPTPNN